MKLDVLNNKELIDLAYQLFNEINKRRAEKEGQLIRQGLLKMCDNRIPYEFIDMDEIEEDLLLVLANYYDNNGYRYDVKDHKVIKQVSLAGMCQLIKSPYYTKSYLHAYQEVTGLEVSNRFYTILESSFKIEGILPDDWEHLKGFRYKDVLINEAGIPTTLINDLIDFFLLYWKYFRDKSIEEVFNELSNKQISYNFKFENKDFEVINETYKVIKEYPRKVFRVISQFSEVCGLLESGEYSNEEINSEDTIVSINQVLSFDMYRILPRKDSLKSLYNKILNQVTPDRFRNLLKSRPSQLYITTPAGNYIKIYNYDDMQLGEHRLANIVYNVVLDKHLSTNELINWPYDELIEGSNTIGFRSRNSFKVSYGKYRQGKTYPFYLKGIFEGYYWYGVVPKGLPLIIGNRIVNPNEPIHYNNHFKYYWDNDMQTYKFKVSMTDIRLYIPQYKNRQLSLRCNFSSISKDFLLDSYGTREIEKYDFYLNNDIFEEKRVFDLCLKESEEHVVIHQLEAGKFESIYCFSKVDSSIVSPGEHQYGNTNFLVFISQGCKDKIVIDSKVTSIKEYPTNIYKIYMIIWEDYKLPLEFSIGSSAWTFREPVIFYLKDSNNVNNDDEIGEDLVKEYTSLDSVYYELVTNLTESELYSVYLVIFYGRDNYREFQISNVLLKENEQYFISGETIRKKIGLECSFIGRVGLSFSYKRKRIHEKHIIVFPTIKIEGIQNLYLENERVDVKLTASMECFFESGCYCNTVNRMLGSAKISNENNGLKAEAIVAEEYIPNLDKFYSFKYVPSILAYRFINTISAERVHIHLNSIDYNDLEDFVLQVLGASNSSIKIALNSYTQELKTNEFGIAQYSLSNMKDKINKNCSRIEIFHLNKSTFFTVKWEPKVYGVVQINKDIINEAGFEIDYDGPNDTNIIVTLADIYGKIIYDEKLNCPGKRAKISRFYQIPNTYLNNEVLINIAFEYDEDSLISQLVYNVVSKKWYNNIDTYPHEQFISEIKRYSSIASNFVKRKIKGEDNYE